MSFIIRIFAKREMLFILLLGFSSGLPLALTGGTLQAWMKDENIDLKVIGLFSLVGLPYTLKFVWAPLVDRFVPSVMKRPFLGRRRGWMVLSQLGLIAAIFAIAVSSPSKEPLWIAQLALAIAFLSATQDIVIDAYRAEVLKKEEFGVGVSLTVLGYRLGMLASASGALILADYLPWRSVYAIMALLLLIGTLAAFFAPEPSLELKPPSTIQEAVVQPFLDYFKRNGAVEILAFIILYKIGDVMAATLTTPFMLELGFSKQEIGAVTKAFGLLATIAGSIFGGAIMMRLGMKRSLWMFGILQAISTLCFSVLAIAWKNSVVMAATIAIENVCGGMGTAAFLAFLMSLCNKRFTATQYALLTSLGAVSRVLAGAPTGFLVESVGWVQFFVLCTFAAVPGLVLIIWRYDRWVEN